MSFDKILNRIVNLTKMEPKLEKVEPDVIAQQVISRIHDNISSKELDKLSAELSIDKILISDEYDTLASRIIVSNLHKETPKSFSLAMELLFKHNVINKKVIDVVRNNKDLFDKMCEDNRHNDYTYSYFSYKTLEKSYLQKINKDTNGHGQIVETMQYMLMRVSIGIHYNDIENVCNTYYMLSDKMFTHASPTLFNSGCNREQLASCFLLGIGDDIKEIFKCIGDCAAISKYAGGIGVHVTNIRAKGSKIRSTNSISDGIVPMLKVLNETARYANQSQRRKGGFAIYLEPWHSDVFSFLELPLKNGDENKRARDLFYSLWIPDIFMKQVENNSDWWLMCPDECPGLVDNYGEEFDKLYLEYVEKGMFRKKIKARDLWDKIIITQIETGVPYISYKDAVNKKSNQKNLGTIRSSNLCNEINIYSDTKEYGTCNLSSISLPSFIEIDKKTNKKYINYSKLQDVVRQNVINLNKIIDNSFYPVPEAELSNKRHRPIGIGVQGLANLFYELKVPFESDKAKSLNKVIFETIYYSAIKSSCELAKKYGPYSTFENSDFSKGIFQFDYNPDKESILSGKYNWDELRQDVMKYGVRNSLLTALMPTASTSNIMNNFESFEPITHNLFTRGIEAGTYFILNKHLVKDLESLGLYNEKMVSKIKQHYGSIQKIEEIPDNLKFLYKDVYEIPQKVLIDLSADRQNFIDQSQSLNIYFENPTISKMTSMHFYGWKKGLKTGMYYLRSSPASNPEQFTVVGEVLGEVADNNDKPKDKSHEDEGDGGDGGDDQDKKLASYLCSINNKEECEMCSG